MSDIMWYTPVINKYPVIFKNLEYIECEEGWSKLISNLADVLETYVKFSVPEDLKEQIFAVQVKQKFGGLRFYMSHETPYINGAISLAERQSYCTCEVCGNSGSEQTIRGWIQVLCDSCKTNSLEKFSNK